MAEDESILASLGLSPDDKLLDAPDAVWDAAITAALDPATRSSGADTVPIMDDQPVVPDDEEAFAVEVVAEDQPGSNPNTDQSHDTDLDSAAESDDADLPVLDHNSLGDARQHHHNAADTDAIDL